MIKFENVVKKYKGNKYVVKDLSFEVAEGETLVLLGKSGCGKSTILRMINRLIDPTAGNIFVDNENILTQDLNNLRRMIGMAIQGTGLFPHMTIEENISIAPKLLNWNEEKIDARIDQLLEMVELDKNYRKRFPHNLSGGQRQRVGVARALAADPKILLMDEPFGALDPVTRDQVQQQFLDILDNETKTTIFVTHDIFEAVILADRIVLLDEGRVVQIATPEELIQNPENEFVEAFLGPHMFQLSMMTKKIGPLVELYEKTKLLERKPKYRLTTKDTLIEALDVFKVSGLTTLPVLKANREIGLLRKQNLTAILIDLLAEKNPEEMLV